MTRIFAREKVECRRGKYQVYYDLNAEKRKTAQIQRCLSSAFVATEVVLLHGARSQGRVRTIAVCMRTGGQEKSSLRGFDLLVRDLEDAARVLRHWTRWDSPDPEPSPVSENESEAELKSVTAQTLFQTAMRARDQAASAAWVVIGRARWMWKVTDRAVAWVVLSSRESMSRLLDAHASRSNGIIQLLGLASAAMERAQAALIPHLPAPSSLGRRGQWRMLTSFDWQVVDPHNLPISNSFTLDSKMKPSSSLESTSKSRVGESVSVVDDAQVPEATETSSSVHPDFVSILLERKRWRRREIGARIVQSSRRSQRTSVSGMIASSSAAIVKWISYPLLDVGQRNARSSLAQMSSRQHTTPTSAPQRKASMTSQKGSMPAVEEAVAVGNTVVVMAPVQPKLEVETSREAPVPLSEGARLRHLLTGASLAFLLPSAAAAMVSGTTVALTAMAVGSIALIVEEARASSSFSPDMSRSSFQEVRKDWHRRGVSSSSRTTRYLPIVVESLGSATGAVPKQWESRTAQPETKEYPEMAIDASARMVPNSKRQRSAPSAVVFGMDAILAVVERILGRMYRRILASGILRADRNPGWKLLRSLSTQRHVY